MDESLLSARLDVRSFRRLVHIVRGRTTNPQTSGTAKRFAEPSPPRPLWGSHRRRQRLRPEALGPSEQLALRLGGPQVPKNVQREHPIRKPDDFGMLESRDFRGTSVQSDNLMEAALPQSGHADAAGATASWRSLLCADSRWALPRTVWTPCLRLWRCICGGAHLSK